MSFLKKIFKKTVKSRAFMSVATALIAFYLWFVWKTSRFQVEGNEAVENALLTEKSIIVCFWHSHMSLCPFAWQKPEHPFDMLISGHSDGQWISQIVSYFNIHTVAGSSSHGGVQALKKMIRGLNEGRCVGITPDGPRGPREVVKEGIFALSSLSGKPVFALAFRLSKEKVINSWDRFKIPLPFSRGVFVWRPCGTAKSQTKELFLENVTQQLQEAVQQAVHGII
jgi:lysophospholipid acyltransferase (LPLAT)-like uncharacterized protein